MAVVYHTSVPQLSFACHVEVNLTVVSMDDDIICSHSHYDLYHNTIAMPLNECC